MGSFAFTCCISGLPIHGGDKVRFFLLNKNPFYGKVQDACEMNGIWEPRTFPLRATYDDYGRAVEIEKGPEKQVWLKGFQYDLLERGTGHNSCHDIPVRKSMKFSKLMEAIWESRLRVKMVNFRSLLLNNASLEAEALSGTPAQPVTKLNPAIPNLRRVRKILRGSGFKVSDKGFCDGYLLNKKSFGCVRIRWSYGGDIQGKLTLLQPALSERFETELHPGELFEGSVSYKEEPCLLVKPKSGSVDLKTLKPKKETKVLVAQAMVREDVWEVILDLNRIELSKVEKRVRDLWDDLGKTTDDGFIRDLKSSESLRWLNDGFCLGLDAHFELMRGLNPDSTQLDQFLSTVAEMLTLRNTLAQTRYLWRPSTSVGPQFGNWGAHSKLLHALAGVADGCYQADQDERDAIDGKLLT
jgi:hypothetical protein